MSKVSLPLSAPRLDPFIMTENEATSQDSNPSICQILSHTYLDAQTDSRQQCICHMQQPALLSIVGFEVPIQVAHLDGALGDRFCEFLNWPSSACHCRHCQAYRECRFGT